MQIEYRDPRGLKPHEAHARIYLPGDIESLVDSIKKAGKVKRPLDITPEGFILGGVRRNLAAIEAGLKEVPVYVWQLGEDEQVEHILDDNLQRVKQWIEVANEIAEKRRLIGKHQGVRNRDEKINTQKQIAAELGIKPNVVRVLEMIHEQPEHHAVLKRDTVHNTVNKLETDFNKRLEVTDTVIEDEFPVVDLLPHRCPTCHSYPRRIFTDYVNRLMQYVDERDLGI